MFEIVVIVCCLVIIALLARLERKYREMEDQQVLQYTHGRAVLKNEAVSLEDAVRRSRRHRVLYRAVRDAYFLVAVVMTVATVYRIINAHPWYLSYLKVTSNSIVVDIRLFLGVLMIFSFWAVFITLCYAGGKITGREKDVLDRLREAGE